MADSSIPVVDSLAKIREKDRLRKEKLRAQRTDADRKKVAEYMKAYRANHKPKPSDKVRRFK